MLPATTSKRKVVTEIGFAAQFVLLRNPQCDVGDITIVWFVVFGVDVGRKAISKSTIAPATGASGVAGNSPSRACTLHYVSTYQDRNTATRRFLNNLQTHTVLNSHVYVKRTLLSLIASQSFLPNGKYLSLLGGSQ